MTRRPTEAHTRAAIERFFLEEFGSVPDYALHPDGDDFAAENKCGWAFWLTFDGGDRSSPVTSYVHEDLSIEWYDSMRVPSPTTES